MSAWLVISRGMTASNRHLLGQMTKGPCDQMGLDIWPCAVHAYLSPTLTITNTDHLSQSLWLLVKWSSGRNGMITILPWAVTGYNCNKTNSNVHEPLLFYTRTHVPELILTKCCLYINVQSNGLLVLCSSC